MAVVNSAWEWRSRRLAREPATAISAERAPGPGAFSAGRAGFFLIAGLVAVLSAAGPAGAGGTRGAPAGPPAALHGVAGDASSGVAVGVGVVWWSVPTHLVWHPATGIDSALTYTSVVKAGGRYLATAADGSIWISAEAEGKSFARGAAAAPGPLRAIAEVGGAALVAVGDGGTITRCANLQGQAWTGLASPVSAHLHGIAYNGVSAVAVGDDGTLLRAGAPGAQWQIVDIDETRDLLAVTADPPPGEVGRYLAAGRDGALWRGDGSGLTWTRLDGVSTGALHGAAWIGPSAVLVGDAGAIYWSPGGFENWEPAEPAVTTNLYAVALAGNELLAVGADGVVLWSNWLDGRVWRLADVPVPVSGVSWGRMKQLFRH